MDTHLFPASAEPIDGKAPPFPASQEQTLFRDRDVLFLIAQVIATHRRHAQALLVELGLPGSGTKADQAKMLQVAVDQGRLTPDRLVEFLDEIQAWGNQRVFLFRAPGAVVLRWRSEAYVRAALTIAKMEHLLNSRRTIFLPESATVSSITLTDVLFTITWVQARHWFEKVGERYEDGGDRREKTEMKRTTRALFSFELDLESGVAMIRVPQLSGRPDYEDLKDNVVSWLARFLDVAAFEVVDPSPAIEGLQKQPDITVRKAGYRDSRDGRISLASADSESDVFDSPEAVLIKSALADSPPKTGSFYLEPNGEFDRRLHFLVDGGEKSITISGQQTEEEVRHVLGRIQRLSGR
jgi:hypothetical protein